MSEPLELYRPYVENIQESGDTHYRGTCPCPRKSKRSFHFHKDTGYYGCWSCDDHGSLYKFLTSKGMDVGRAKSISQEVRDSAPSEVIQLKRKQAAAVARNDILPDYVLAEFHNCPVALLEAGFPEQLLERYDVGFDVARQRITFGIRDKEGNLVGVSGRAALADQVPKYKVYDARPAEPHRNRPEGALRQYKEDYVPRNKAHLYGAHTFWGLRSHKRLDGEVPIPVVITEGYKSTLWMRHLDFQYSVGLQGSLMTREQMAVLLELGGPFVVLLDYEPGKQFPDPDQMKKRAKLLLNKQFREADRTRPCDAVQIALWLQRKGASALIGKYPPDSPVGTAPDDLAKDQLTYAIENAATPTSVVLDGARHARTGG